MHPYFYSVHIFTMQRSWISLQQLLSVCRLCSRIAWHWLSAKLLKIWVAQKLEHWPRYSVCSKRLLSLDAICSLQSVGIWQSYGKVARLWLTLTMAGFVLRHPANLKQNYKYRIIYWRGRSWRWCSRTRRRLWLAADRRAMTRLYNAAVL